MGEVAKTVTHDDGHKTMTITMITVIITMMITVMITMKLEP